MTKLSHLNVYLLFIGKLVFLSKDDDKLSPCYILPFFEEACPRLHLYFNKDIYRDIYKDIYTQSNQSWHVSPSGKHDFQEWTNPSNFIHMINHILLSNTNNMSPIQSIRKGDQILMLKDMMYKSNILEIIFSIDRKYYKNRS